MNLKNGLDTVKRYRATYKNWFRVLFNLKYERTPFQAILREKKYGYVEIFNREQASLITLGMDVEYDNVLKCLVFPYNNRRVFMKGADLGHGDIRGVFLHEEYKFLLAENKTIIDVGANIGDSSVYFAINGMKLIALEPYPSNVRLAEENVKINGCADRVMVVNAALGGAVDFVKVDSLNIPDKGSDLKAVENGQEIPVLTLDEVLKKYGVNEAFLKMDCEGCEYEVFNRVSDATILKFSRIAMEYHHGPDILVSRLKNLGYDVKYTAPRRTRNQFSDDPEYNEGFIYAARIPH
jgi:FkbM family methyltransferase